MANIIESQDLPEGDKVYLKKDWFGWRTVEPIKNSDGKINYINLLFGGYRNLIFLGFVFLVIGFALFSYNHDMKAIENNYKEISSDPVSYCKAVINNPALYSQGKVNLSELKLNEQ